MPKDFHELQGKMEGANRNVLIPRVCALLSSLCVFQGGQKQCSHERGFPAHRRCPAQEHAHSEGTHRTQDVEFGIIEVFSFVLLRSRAQG